MGENYSGIHVNHMYDNDIFSFMSYMVFFFTLLHKNWHNVC